MYDLRFMNDDFMTCKNSRCKIGLLTKTKQSFIEKKQAAT
jgi:hypothetical protein